MKIATLAALLAVVPLSAGAQTAERKNGALVSADFNYNLRSRCIWNQHSYALSAKLFVRFQPDQRLAAGEGVDITLIPSSGDGPPTIYTHAINTKGTGAQNGRTIPQTCAAQPAQALSPSASCTLSDGPDGITAWSFTLPGTALEDESGKGAKTGHITLMKRGDASGGAKIIAPCTSTGAAAHGSKIAGYDLAVSKKV